MGSIDTSIFPGVEEREILLLHVAEELSENMKNYVSFTVVVPFFGKSREGGIFLLQLFRLTLAAKVKILYENKGLWIDKKLGGIYFFRRTNSFRVISARIRVPLA